MNTRHSIFIGLIVTLLVTGRAISVHAATVSIDQPTVAIAAPLAEVQVNAAFERTAVTAPTVVDLTLMVTNTGAATVTGLGLQVMLPIEFTYVNGTPDLSTLGNLAPGETITKTYPVSIPSSATSNRYVTEVTATATNAESIEAFAGLDVSNGRVLGATDSTVTLAATGTSPLLGITLGTILLTLGFVQLRRTV